jgi:3-methyladenine DNA glycosylase AlkD
VKPAKYIADHLRQVLVNGASAPHTAEVQHFFKEEIQSRGWYTGEIRKLARRFERVIKGDAGLDYLVSVADQLYRGRVLEEKVLAVALLERSVGKFGTKEFKLFESWLERISTWADHDALVHSLIGPLVLADETRIKNVFRWARSKSRWHRRAAAVSLIRSAREKKHFEEIVRMSDMLLGDKDDIVQKGVGWLLRETAKHDAKRTVPYLMKIRERAPRLVLRTGCETLPAELKNRVLNGKVAVRNGSRRTSTKVPVRLSKTAT